MILDGSGNLCGAAQAGGTGCQGEGACGTVFELSPNGSGGWTETIIYSFPSQGSEGFLPNPGLIFDQSGNLYGTTYERGSGDFASNYGCGTAFELSPNGSGAWMETRLYNFQGNSDGYAPTSGLIFDQAGNLYGTASAGGGTGCGGPGCGTVFELSPSGSGGWTEVTLYSFQDGSDGGSPVAGLIFDKNGNLYGTDLEGDTACNSGIGCGTVFELSPNGSGGWTESPLYNFQGGSDGMFPFSGVIFDRTGNLYGTTVYGGGTACFDGDGCDVVYEVTREPFAKLSPTSLAFSRCWQESAPADCW